jgi:hypothetical protein
MKTIALLTILTAVSADQYKIAFRGLDEKYALTKNAISALREIISCRANVPHQSVTLSTITIRNTTWIVPQNDEVNIEPQAYPRNCHLTNTIHWDTFHQPGISHLMRSLHDEPLLEYTLDIPVHPSRAFGSNIISFLATSINEKYADILVSDYMAFYAGSKPEMIQRHPGHIDEYRMLFYMFIVQVLILIIGNILMRRARHTVLPLSNAAVHGTRVKILENIIIQK